MSKRDKNCQIPTPIQYVDQMLDLVGYKHDLQGRRVLENSCGEGNILVEVVRRYIWDMRENRRTPKEIAAGLEQDITAYEVDREKIEICRSRLNELVSAEALPGVRWDIRHQDYLKSKDQKADFVIGNPPYITYHDLTEEERTFLQNKYSVCERGRFDYCYAFIEASVRALTDHGKMIYLIPFSIFRNRFAAYLRMFLRDYIAKIVDYRSIRVFPGITCSASIILCENGCTEDKVEYEDISARESFFVERSTLSEKGEKWIFHRTTEGERRFGDFFNVHNGVATLYNKAFLFPAEETDGEYYVIDGMPVEKDATLPAVSAKSCRAAKKGGKAFRIIFPYQWEAGRIVRYQEEEFKKKYPCAWEYLYRFYDALTKRKADEKAMWFEYGRSQALTEVFEEKLVIPMVITNSVEAYIAGENAIPYAGYFITADPEGDMSLEDAKKLLESRQFYQYVQEVGTPTTISSYRVSVHDIDEFMFQWGK